MVELQILNIVPTMNYWRQDSLGDTEYLDVLHDRGVDSTLETMDANRKRVKLQNHYDTDAERLRVLVVDDHADTRDTMLVLMQIWGVEARLASNGTAALEIAREFLPHVVLLDLSMPGMTGAAVAKRIRESVALRQAVLIAVSGYRADEIMKQDDLAHFQACLLKPADPATLRAILASAARAAGLSSTRLSVSA